MVEYDTDMPVKTWVPYPVGFSSLQVLFKKAGYHNVIRLKDYPSVFGNMMYTALIQKN